jgi:hypothetical protein
MHRRGLALLIGFLVAVVVAGGGGVRAPWQPATESAGPTTARSANLDHGVTLPGRVRME